jgi:hypothetical protein
MSLNPPSRYRTPKSPSSPTSSTSSQSSDHSRPQSDTSDATLIASPASPSFTNSSSDSLGYMPAYYKTKFPVHSRIPDRPLIDQVTNEWRTNPKYIDFYDAYDEDDYGQLYKVKGALRRRRCPIALPRRPQRLVVVYFFILLILYSFWRFFIRSSIDTEEQYKWDVFDYQSQLQGRRFGSNARPEFTDMTQIQYLDSRHVPGASSRSPKRLIFIGDVHGCKSECTFDLSFCTLNKLTSR